MSRSIVRCCQPASGTVLQPSRSHRPMSLRPAIPRRVALLHCSPPLHRLPPMVKPIAGNRQPPLGQGWGIFTRRNGDFLAGVDRCTERSINTIHIQPGKPAQNGHVESFHGRLRDECLNASWFWNLWDARRKIACWRIEYNQQRPHSSLAYQTPEEFAHAWAEAASRSATRITTPPEPDQGQALRAPAAALIRPRLRGQANCQDRDAAIYAPHSCIT
jgi:transposase InsO family protein